MSRLLPILMLSTLSNTLWASDYYSGFSLGLAPWGSLNTGQSLPLSLGPLLGVTVQKHGIGSGGDQWIAEISMHLASISYQAGADKRTGVYYAMGLGGGYAWTLSPKTDVQLLFTLFPIAALKASSQSSSLINGKKVSYATLSEFSGGLGFRTLARLNRDITFLWWNLPLRLGLSLGFIYHNFAKRQDSSAISDPSLQPEASQSAGRQASLSILTLEGSVGWPF